MNFSIIVLLILLVIYFMKKRKITGQDFLALGYILLVVYFLAI